VCPASQRVVTKSGGYHLEDEIREGSAMDNEVTSQSESGEEIFVFDIPDDALERAGSAWQNVFTVGFCTHNWYDCGLPL
jgi:hypothetical protein